MSRATDKALVRRARAQGGRLSRADATALLRRPDVLEHLVAGGLWQEALPGVLVPAAVPVDRDRKESAVGLWDDRAALSHFSAARREGIWVPDHPDAWATVEFESSRRSLVGLRVVRTRSFPTRWVVEGCDRWTTRPGPSSTLPRC